MARERRFFAFHCALGRYHAFNAKFQNQEGEFRMIATPRRIWIWLCLPLAATALAAAAKTVYVQTRTTEVREAPNYFSKIVGKLDNGDAVTVTEEQGSWNKIAGAKEIGRAHV
jgi:hypothetical protein